MTPVISGLLLPESILNEPWFRTFTLFVAFNTIVYLGLTVSKLAPWPAQIRPARVRTILINKLDSLQWSIAALAAFAMGLLGLQVRRFSVDRLLLEEMRGHRLATTDPLTQTLTRSAVGVLVPGVVEAATAARVPVHGIRVGVRDLTRINADYGIEYGDALLRVVAQAVKEVVPRGDLVARWEGDCFLAVGPGPAPTAEEMTAAVEGVVRDRGIALGKRPVSVATGSISMSAADATLEVLASSARASLLP
jgi:GGDEF domain-containing protein